jgi:hypothetical protein
MTKWSLPVLLEGLHQSVTERLSRSRRTMGHPVAKGDAAEGGRLLRAGEAGVSA